MTTETLPRPAHPTTRGTKSKNKPNRQGIRQKGAIGWIFISPFLAVFLLFLVIPLGYALYLSLFTKGLATGTTFSGIDNYVKAFTDPSFLKGAGFVLAFTAVLVPVQMIVSVAAALVLDELASRFARLARLAIFLPYAIPAVIGALMWGFLYSPTFGPLDGIFGFFGAQAPLLLGPDSIFGSLINVVTWQWAGYYMIIVFAALQGIDPSIYEAARLDGANSWQIALRVKLPMVSNALVLILVFAVIGTLQFFTEPQILAPVANGTVTPDFTPNIYAYNLAFTYAQFNYASAISFALGIVIFIAVYVFLFFTRKRGSVFA
ncbi:sugar ABC transporter permease [Cryobacterium lactosi]|uniref:Sugar ABC transporter permease n=1 Tax=Cryobacterium lactosi TaxID=1259202 RepID=A0A4R9BV01_9MICO|nr:sugar ABC transporter permease [Cryobacterium lactosi]TFD91548.1 sugar ABC transporter permease [Cryobacterium lactosi]